MVRFQAFDAAPLDAAGLNLQAVFNLADLPDEARAGLISAYPDATSYRQLILLGHAGKDLWQAVQAAGIESPDPIDDFCMQVVKSWCGEMRHQIIYPGSQAVGLQALGKLAGWHHASPFMVGIRPGWGTWFAYRALILTDSDFVPSQRVEEISPCIECRDRPCIAACPGKALAGDHFSLSKCIGCRKQPASPCRETCLSRMTCPIGREHRYTQAQMRHTYSISMRMINQHY